MFVHVSYFQLQFSLRLHPFITSSFFNTFLTPLCQTFSVKESFSQSEFLGPDVLNGCSLSSIEGFVRVH